MLLSIRVTLYNDRPNVQTVFDHTIANDIAYEYGMQNTKYLPRVEEPC